jgi:hypothetical protein
MGGVIKQPGRSGVRNTAGGRQSSSSSLAKAMAAIKKYSGKIYKNALRH